MHELRVSIGIMATVLGLGLAAASYPDSANVFLTSSAPLSCGTRTSTSVRFRTLVVPGPSSVVTYRRLGVKASDLAAAVNETKAITATDVVQCAKKAALAGMAGFSFNGTCTAYKFGSKLCSCSPGEEVVYVTNASAFFGPPSAVPLSAAPYINTTVENIPFKQYRILKFVADDAEVEVFSSAGVAQYFAFEAYFIPRDDGNYYGVPVAVLDLAYCVTDSSCGLPVLVYATYSTYYILNECGNTITLTASPSHFYVTAFSHPGYGCKAFPDGPTYNCSVTFTAASNFSLGLFGRHFIGSDGSCDGYNLTASYGATQDANFCIPKLEIHRIRSVTLTLRGAALANTFKGGFVSVFQLY
ncbi:uncharacterized protein LOC108672380 [Hyalella azteca]|uniref:Uncharacterized protein LOC108672380 n=1 Tax=Hyalella azteca TaxID=294128 RepID=A0A8B7NP92_HYAAZ|nr:uncharacterized protein LOC108672380 [Hyalella azteca]XP_047740949.1 uncharacterized protein LOC108672380 [Hyalella azteca]XP_047740950.1 uncharacterized protein LOC108672380 [Hyalella azteca]XP_047740951.1 uncharacterized protein LOC108672380 [Hyalella azteca]